MRLIMMGTGPFAVPTFQALYATHHAVAALVTAPLRVHRGKEVAPASPMRDIAARARHADLRPGRTSTRAEAQAAV